MLNRIVMQYILFSRAFKAHFALFPAWFRVSRAIYDPYVSIPIKYIKNVPHIFVFPGSNTALAISFAQVLFSLNSLSEETWSPNT